MSVHTGTEHRSGAGTNFAEGVATGAQLGKAIKKGIAKRQEKKKSKATHTTAPRKTHGRGGAHQQPKVRRGGWGERIAAMRAGQKDK